MIIPILLVIIILILSIPYLVEFFKGCSQNIDEIKEAIEAWTLIGSMFGALYLIYMVR